MLALKHNSKWGSIGLSRRRELYYKEIGFDSLADLVLEFKRSYERVFHSLKRVKVGLPMSHDVYAGEYVCWDFFVTKCADLPTATALLAEHGRTAHRLHEQWRNECKKHGSGPNQKIPTANVKKVAASTAMAAKKRTTPGASDSDSSGAEDHTAGKQAVAEEQRLEAETGSQSIDGIPTSRLTHQSEMQRISFLAV